MIGIDYFTILLQDNLWLYMFVTEDVVVLLGCYFDDNVSNVQFLK